MKNFVLGKYALRIMFCFLAAIINVEAGTILDYDGDGRTDLVVRRFDQSVPYFVWYILQSRDGFRAQVWGLREGQPFGDSLRFVGDYDGDGKNDFAAARTVAGNEQYENWYILSSRDNTMMSVLFMTGQRAVPQDYDGDGKTDIAVYRLGWWYIRQSSNNQLYAEQFGRGSTGTGGSSLPADVPLSGGDYDGDGKADLAVVRYTPPNPAGTAIPMTLYIRRSLDRTWASYNLGDARFTGVLSGDYDGDGRADVAIWQGNLWLWNRSSDNQLQGVRFGTGAASTEDAPVPGDYDGDGKFDPAVYRRGFPQSYFYILQSRDGFRAVQWGNNQDGTDGSFGAGGTRYIPAVGF